MAASGAAGFGDAHGTLDVILALRGVAHMYHEACRDTRAEWRRGAAILSALILGALEPPQPPTPPAPDDIMEDCLVKPLPAALVDWSCAVARAHASFAGGAAPHIRLHMPSADGQGTLKHKPAEVTTQLFYQLIGAEDTHDFKPHMYRDLLTSIWDVIDTSASGLPEAVGFPTDRPTANLTAANAHVAAAVGHLCLAEMVRACHVLEDGTAIASARGARDAILGAAAASHSLAATAATATAAAASPHEAPAYVATGMDIDGDEIDLLDDNDIFCLDLAEAGGGPAAARGTDGGAGALAPAPPLPTTGMPPSLADAADRLSADGGLPDAGDDETGGSHVQDSSASDLVVTAADALMLHGDMLVDPAEWEEILVGAQQHLHPPLQHRFDAARD